MKNHFFSLSVCIITIFCSCNTVFETGKRQYVSPSVFEQIEQHKKTTHKNSLKISDYPTVKLNLSKIDSIETNSLNDEFQYNTNNKQPFYSIENIESNEITNLRVKKYSENSDLKIADYYSITSDYKGNMKKSISHKTDDEYKGSIILRIFATLGIAALFMMLIYLTVTVASLLIWSGAGVLSIIILIAGIAFSILLTIKLMKALWKLKKAPEVEEST